MQRERETRDEPINSTNSNPEGFSSHRRSMMSSILGGRDPFDDPFFTQPFGSSIFEPRIFNKQGSSDDLLNLNPNSSKGLVIEEIDTDDDEGEEDQNGNSEAIDNKSHKTPLIEHPDDEDEVKKESYKNINRTKAQTQSVSFKKVTYGGINGAYYTATTTRKSGSDGVVLEDTKEADKTTGQAKHRISKGIHDKGHSVTRKLGTDGEVDTVQTLHNLNQDELASFEQAWEDKRVPGWYEEFNSFGTPGFGRVGPFGLALELGGRSQSSDNQAQTSSSRGQPKKVVTINID